MEGDVVAFAKLSNEKTDPNAPPPTAGGDKPLPGTRPEFIAGGGNTGGYNYGWLDPGSAVMRVNGQPRTSIITTPNGRAPAFKAGVKGPKSYGRGFGGMAAAGWARSTIRKTARWANAASSASAATPARRCWPTASTTTTISSFRPGTPSPSMWRWCTTCA